MRPRCEMPRDQRFLYGVGGVLGISGGAQGDCPQPVAVPAYQFVERIGISLDMGSQKRVVTGGAQRRRFALGADAFGGGHECRP